MDFSTLQGKTLVKAFQTDNDRIFFECDDGTRYVLFHSQDCCESVYVESITGELADLIGVPILLADEASNTDDPDDVKRDPTHYPAESQTWTFYKLRTIKGSVDIRWYGSSNGYYSESVSFEETA